MSFFSRIGSALGKFFGGMKSAGGGAAKLGAIQSGIQKLGTAANVVQKLGIGGPTVQKIAGGISKLPLEEIGKSAQGAFDIGKQIFETGKKVREAFKPESQALPAEVQRVRPVAMGGANQPVLNLEDL